LHQLTTPRAFLWFLGAVRDGLGRFEDRFFASVLPGSGLLFLAMMFVSTAVAAALLASNTGVTDPAAHAEVIAFGTMIVVSACKTYAIRMAAVFMMSLGHHLAENRVDAAVAGRGQLSGRARAADRR
jgi:hypothetical protein